MLLDKNMTKVEIEQFLEGKGDFVRMDYLQRYVAIKGLPLDKRKFAFGLLAAIYAKKNMFLDAAKMQHNIAEASIAFSEKISAHVKEAEYAIKGGLFDVADAAVKKAMVEANVSQRAEIFVQIKEFYKSQAATFERAAKRRQAAALYEKLLHMNISDVEREEIKAKLLPLYEKLGRMRDYAALRDGKLYKSR